MNRLILDDEIDLAYVCSGPFLYLLQKGIELLCAPVVFGKKKYQSYLIVSQDSPIKDLRELKGRRFAFSDPISFTGRIYPTWFLAKLEISKASLEANSVYSGSHDRSIELVAEGKVDGAEVDGLIYDYLITIDSSLLEKIRVIHKSAEFGMPPIVVRKGFPKELKKRILHILLDANNDKEGKKILSGLQISEFRIPALEEYQTNFSILAGFERLSH